METCLACALNFTHPVCNSNPNPNPIPTQVDVLDLTSCHWNPRSTDPTVTWDQQNTVEWWEAFKTLNTTFGEHMIDTIR